MERAGQTIHVGIGSRPIERVGRLSQSRKRSPMRLFIMALLLNLSLHAQTLWREAKAGMTPQELTQAIEGLHALPSDPIHRQVDGSVDMYRLKNVEIAGYIFEAHFHFYNKKLSSVWLEVDTTVKSFLLPKLLSTTVELMTQKYGPPQRVEPGEEKGMGTTVLWSKYGIDIKIYCRESGGILNIIYSTHIEYDKRNI